MEDGQDMFKAFHSAVQDKTGFTQTRCSKGFNRAVRLKLDSVVDAQKWPFYEIAWVDHCVTRARIDFVPVDLALDGMIDLMQP